MSNRKCCVPGCVNSLETEVNLHQFPNPDKDKELFKTWVYSIGGDILQLENNHIFKYRRVCHIHFDRKYWCRNNRITKEAVPTINMPGTSSSIIITALLLVTWLEQKGSAKPQPKPNRINYSFSSFF